MVVHKQTVHHSRTIMFQELQRVLDFGIEDDSYQTSMEQNVLSKNTSSNQEKTNWYLKKLYRFDLNDNEFLCLKYFWINTPLEYKPLLALVCSIANDFLLRESISVVMNTTLGEKVEIEKFEMNIEAYHPDRFSKKSKRSNAQNIASSWKQTGFIQGRMKNIRVRPELSYQVIAFALIIGYLKGLRGDFLVTSNLVKALDVPSSKLKDYISEAASHDLLKFQSSGNVNTFSFKQLIENLELDGVEN